MTKILRNMSTEASRAFWETVESSAAEVEQWPAWKRAGINVAQVRDEAEGALAEPRPAEGTPPSDQ